MDAKTRYPGNIAFLRNRISRQCLILAVTKITTNLLKKKKNLKQYRNIVGKPP